MHDMHTAEGGAALGPRARLGPMKRIRHIYIYIYCVYIVSQQTLWAFLLILCWLEMEKKCRQKGLRDGSRHGKGVECKWQMNLKPILGKVNTL